VREEDRDHAGWLAAGDTAMKKPRVRIGRKYHRGRLWIERRDAAFARAGDKCEVSGEPLSFVTRTCDGWINCERICVNPKHLKVIYKRACHHVLAERWVRSFVKGADVHILENLVTVTPALHARLTHAEYKLFRADWIGYRQELNRLGLDLALLDRAMKAICESVKK